MKHAVEHVHFVGIGGAGMSGIAQVLQRMGYRISGSDLHHSPATEHLQSLGVHVFSPGHRAEQVQAADVVVVSSAIEENNVEVQAARAAHIPVIPRALMLAELMRGKRGVAVAGTHGKTTTTSLIASVLTEGGLDPTYIIGGVLNSTGSSASLGQSEFMVVEADESDASFLNLLPTLAVVTNIDQDHMDCYGQDTGRLRKAFVDFLHRMPFYGTAIVCTDDAQLSQILPDIARPLCTYGLGAEAQVRAVDVRAVGTQMHFTVQRQASVVLAQGRKNKTKLGAGHPSPSSHPVHSPQHLANLPITLNLAGLHNVRNALAAIAVATDLGIGDAAVQKALREFKGVGRRFQSHGAVALAQGGHFLLVDDYGHHPQEIAVTLAAARQAYPGQRLVLAFQPHRYSRTRDCFEDFVKVLGQADVLLLGQVYPAGEAPIAAADSHALARAIRVAGQVEPVFVEDIADMPPAILKLAQAGDVVLCMGAGSMGKVPPWVLAQSQDKATHVTHGISSVQTHPVNAP